MVLFDSFSGTRCTCKVFNRLTRALRDEHYLQTALHLIELIKIYKMLFRKGSQYTSTKFFYDFRAKSARNLSKRQNSMQNLLHYH